MQQTVLVGPVPLLKKIATPTPPLWGEPHSLIPFGNLADYLKTSPGVTLVSLPGLGYLAHGKEEPPVQTILSVRTFLFDRRSLD
jgi:hypothetical protein